MQTKQRRRDFLRISRDTLLGAVVGSRLADQVPAAEAKAGVTFSFGTYGMKTMKTEAAIRALAEVGYDGIEITAHSDWDAAPERMSPDRRRHLRALLDDTGLEVTALMEHLYPSRDDKTHAVSLDRLKRVAELGHDLSPNSPPLIQTVLGGGKWDRVKNMFRDRLADWAEGAEETKTVIAIKPHRGGAMSRPSEAAWLIGQLENTIWIRMVYDYSHYAFREMPLAETIETALPYTAHIAIKDTVKTDKGFKFWLPGASGNFDFVELFKRFYAGGYRGDVCCEVSGQVWNRPGYDPMVAAKKCYTNIAPLFDKARVPRRSS